jgi:uncharacterized lipoprotein YajG
MWGAAALVAALLVTGCSGSDDTPANQPPATTPTTTPTPDRVALETSCRNALRADYETGFDSQGDKWPPSARLPVCSTLDRPTIERLMKEAVDDLMGGTTGP